MIYLVTKKWADESREDILAIAKNKRSAIKLIDFLCGVGNERTLSDTTRTYFAKRINAKKLRSDPTGIVLPEDSGDFDYVYEKTI